MDPGDILFQLGKSFKIPQQEFGACQPVRAADLASNPAHFYSQSFNLIIQSFANSYMPLKSLVGISRQDRKCWIAWTPENRF